MTCLDQFDRTTMLVVLLCAIVLAGVCYRMGQRNMRDRLDAMLRRGGSRFTGLDL